MNNYIIYTDGAYSPNRNIGAIAFVILKEGKIVAEFSKPYKNTTNQRMEQLAIVSALKSIKKADSIKVYSDSAYVVNTYNKGWNRKCNLDIWEQLDKQLKRLGNVEFIHVKGHNNVKYNERCDWFASASTETYR